MPNQHAADQMADAQKFLGRKIPIGKLAGQKRSDDRAERPDGKHVADLARLEMQVAGQIGPKQRQPCAPNRVLQKHHRRELHSQLQRHRRGDCDRREPASEIGHEESSRR